MKRTERTELTISKIQEAALEEFGVNGYSGGTVREEALPFSLCFHSRLTAPEDS